MLVSEFKKIDTNFIEKDFISKVDNRFIKVVSAITKQDIDGVKHFLSKELINKLEDGINRYKDMNQRLVFDEVNVRYSNIKDIIVKSNVYEIKVFLQSRYLNYIINLNDGSYLSGNKNSRVCVDYELTFVRNVDIKEQSNSRKCPSCGNSIDVNDNGKCTYCGTIYNLEDYDWILTKLEVIN